MFLLEFRDCRLLTVYDVIYSDYARFGDSVLHTVV